MPRVDVGGRTLDLTHLDKVLYPETGTTKAEVIDYYRRIAPVLLPHLAGRPITMKRYPHGVDGTSFFEKRCPSYQPDWVPTYQMPSKRHGSIGFCGIDSLAALVWMVNLSSLELHPYLHRVGAPERPTTLVFDLDPGRPADLTDACRVGLVMRRLLEQTGLDCYPKTSGGKGLHIYVPLNSRVTYERTKRFARAVAETLARDDPDDVTSVMAKEKRTGRVFIDWSQNDEHKTTVAVYSLRARHRPTVSAPLHWDEVERGAGLERGATGPAVEIGPAVERVERMGDLFLPVLEQQQELPD